MLYNCIRNLRKMANSIYDFFVININNLITNINSFFYDHVKDDEPELVWAD